MFENNVEWPGPKGPEPLGPAKSGPLLQNNLIGTLISLNSHPRQPLYGK